RAPWGEAHRRPRSRCLDGVGGCAFRDLDCALALVIACLLDQLLVTADNPLGFALARLVHGLNQSQKSAHGKNLRFTRGWRYDARSLRPVRRVTARQNLFSIACRAGGTFENQRAGATGALRFGVGRAASSSTEKAVRASVDRRTKSALNL